MPQDPNPIALPTPFSSIPRTPLLLGPSPIHLLPRITADLQTETATPTIYAKRDDLNTIYSPGGNKTRKLEYHLAAALAANSTTLVTIGGIQSNHTRQVAGIATTHGLKARLIQEHWVNWTDPGYSKTGNIQLSRLMGADISIHDSSFGIGHKETVRSVMAELEEAGERPYYIPAGGSDHPLGGMGYARWAFEVRQQEKEMGVFFGTIVVCVVTGSTFAGMVAGFKLLERMYPAEPKRRVIGIDASGTVPETREQVLRIARDTAGRIGLKGEDIGEEDVVIDGRWNAGIYGVPDRRTWEAIEYAARREALITDPVYEGKSFAGLVDLVRAGEIKEGNVLYAHLGGQLALNAYSEIGQTKD